MNIVRTKLSDTFSTIPNDEDVEYTICSGTRLLPIEVTLFYGSEYKHIYFYHYDFSLPSDFSKIYSEVEKVEIIVGYINDIIFERIMLTT